MVKMKARMPTKEIGPARGPQASAITEAKATSAITEPNAAGKGRHRWTRVLTTQAIRPASGTRRKVRFGVTGTSARLEQITPVSAGSAAAAATTRRTS